MYQQSWLSAPSQWAPVRVPSEVRPNKGLTMNRRYTAIGGAAAVLVGGGVALGLALAGGSSPARPVQVIQPAAAESSIPDSPSAAASSVASAPAPAVASPTDVASPVQATTPITVVSPSTRAQAPAPRVVPQVTQAEAPADTDSAPADTPPPAEKVSDPATEGPNGGPLPGMATYAPPTKPAIAVPPAPIVTLPDAGGN